MNDDPGIPGMPDARDHTAEEASAFLLLKAYDEDTLLSAKKRRTAFALTSSAIRLRDSAAMHQLIELGAEFIGDTVKDRRNVKRILWIAGGAFALLAAKKAIGDDWDDKLSAGLQSIRQSITDKKTFLIERDLGTLGQPQEASRLCDELEGQLLIAGDEAAPGTVATVNAFVRNAIGKVPFLKNKNLDPPLN